MMMIEHVNNSLKEIQEGAILVEGPKVPKDSPHCKYTRDLEITVEWNKA